MNDFEKAEFWEGLNRLYLETVRMKEESEVVNQQILALKDTAQALAETAHEQSVVAQENAKVVMSHERRLDRSEVLIEALLEDMRRYRLSVVNIDERSKKALDLSQSVEQRLEAMLEEWKRRREGNS
jgi:hypothetical protein